MGNFTGKTWSYQRIEWLQRLWGQGHSASKIAEIMGADLTKNAVLGAVHRAGFPKRQSPIKPLNSEQRAARAKPPSRQHIVINVTRDGVKKQHQTAGRPPQQPTALQPVLRDYAPTIHLAPPPPEPKPATPTTPWDGKPVRFNQLEPGQCRWITEPTVRFHADEALSCAAPTVSGQSYCQCHCDQAAGRGTASERRAADGVAA